MKIDYPSGTKIYNVSSGTPSRKDGIKQYARRCYQAVAATAAKSAPTSEKIMREVARTIRREMEDLASADHDSILRDTTEAVKHISWETIALELKKTVPTLMSLLRSLVRNESQPFISSLACQLIKDHHPKLELMQRAVSVLLYGNGTSKHVNFLNYLVYIAIIMLALLQVYQCLNHLNICLSFQGMLNTIKNISQYHDVEVEYWSESLKQQCLEKQQVRKFDFSYNKIIYSMTILFSSEGISSFKPTFRGVSGQFIR